MDEPEISIIMPAYNAEKFIAESIRSVLSQSFSSWELIVVDDGSTDTTSKIVANFQPDKRIKMLKQENKGVSSARNTGINHASGKYVTFLDSDDAYFPDNLETKYNTISADSTIDFVYSDLLFCDSEMRALSVEKGPAESSFVSSWQGKNIPGLSSNIMLRHSVLKNKKIYFDANLSNCADKYFKILLASQCKGAYIPKPLAKYRNTPGSMSKKVFLLEHDELYILDRIKERNIIADNGERNKVFADVYLMLSGSWFKDAGKPGRAIKFAFKALYTRPSIFFRLLNKSYMALKENGK